MRTTHGKEYHEWNNSQDDLLKLKVISEDTTKHEEARATNVKPIKSFNNKHKKTYVTPLLFERNIR